MILYYPLVTAAMAAYFLVIGLRVLVAKKPVMISSRYVFALLVVGFSPQLVNSAIVLSEGTTRGTIWLGALLPVLTLGLVAVFWFHLKGYVAIGISEDSFGEAIRFSLEKNGLPFEEQISAIDLPAVRAKLQVAVRSWAGSGQLRLSGHDDPGLLPRIVTGINDYYAERDIEPTTMASWMYLLIGSLLLTVTGALLVKLW